MAVADEVASTLKALHVPGKPLVLANVFDIASARVVAALPDCKALASASYAIAKAADLEDDDLTLEANLAAVRQIATVAQECGLPLTADFQSGYGARLEEAIRQFIDIGISGCNLEDFDCETRQMYSLDEAVRRIQGILGVAKAMSLPSFALNARCDALVHGGDLADVIERGRAYLKAGANTVFVWGGSKRGVSAQEVRQLVTAFDGRLNVRMKLEPGYLRVRELSDLGVARISVGPDLQTHMLRTLRDQAQAILTEVVRGTAGQLLHPTGRSLSMSCDG